MMLEASWAASLPDGAPPSLASFEIAELLSYLLDRGCIFDVVVVRRLELLTQVVVVRPEFRELIVIRRLHLLHRQDGRRDETDLVQRHRFAGSLAVVTRFVNIVITSWAMKPNSVRFGVMTFW
jgi:hypothetical protein